MKEYDFYIWKKNIISKQAKQQQQMILVPFGNSQLFIKENRKEMKTEKAISSNQMQTDRETKYSVYS